MQSCRGGSEIVSRAHRLVGHLPFTEVPPRGALISHARWEYSPRTTIACYVGVPGSSLVEIDGIVARQGAVPSSGD
jgi:hypothetical protein